MRDPRKCSRRSTFRRRKSIRIQDEKNMNNNEWLKKVLRNDCEIAVSKFVNLFNKMVETDVTEDVIMAFWHLMSALINIELKKYEEKINELEKKNI